MAGPDLIFDGGDLAPAAVDSCGHPLTLFSNLIERAAVAFQYRLLAAQFLPPLHHHVHILRVSLPAEPGVIVKTSSALAASGQMR